jgi:hypothetical protein
MFGAFSTEATGGALKFSSGEPNFFILIGNTKHLN